MTSPLLIARSMADISSESIVHDAAGAHVRGQGVQFSVIGEGARIFRRNAIKIALGPGGESGRRTMLVGELDGVRVYITPQMRIVMTKEDLKW